MHFEKLRKLICVAASKTVKNNRKKRIETNKQQISNNSIFIHDIILILLDTRERFFLRSDNSKFVVISYTLDKIYSLPRALTQGDAILFQIICKKW